MSLTKYTLFDYLGEDRHGPAALDSVSPFVPSSARSLPLPAVRRQLDPSPHRAHWSAPVAGTSGFPRIAIFVAATAADPPIRLASCFVWIAFCISIPVTAAFESSIYLAQSFNVVRNV